MKWTKASVDRYVENHGGEAYSLIDSSFPFNKKDKELIIKWMGDEDLTDSDFADNILELALSKCKE